jgi:hypothetical protein
VGVYEVGAGAFVETVAQAPRALRGGAIGSYRRPELAVAAFLEVSGLCGVRASDKHLRRGRAAARIGR